eukprot:817854-Amphidinium_carterae.1
MSALFNLPFFLALSPCKHHHRTQIRDPPSTPRTHYKYPDRNEQLGERCTKYKAFACGNPRGPECQNNILSS